MPSARARARLLARHGRPSSGSAPALVCPLVLAQAAEIEALPAGHHGNPNAFMPSISGSAPCPSVLIEYASMSANGEFHWDMPASTIALPPLPCEAPACRQCSVENTALAKVLCTALITPVAIITEHDVAARTSGYRHEPGSKMKSMGAKVALLMGRSWKTYS